MFWISGVSPTDLPVICPRQLNLLQQLPQEDTCIMLYSIFKEGVHPLIHLLHTTSFEVSFRRFWNWYNSWNKKCPATGILAEDPSFLSLLLAILFTASLARVRIAEIGNSLLDAPTCSAATLYQLTLSSLSLDGFPQYPKLHSLMAYVLLNNMLFQEGEAGRSCSFVAIAIRMAQAMGLHKDSSSILTLDAVQIEERRRLWCHLMHMDVMTACVSGMPLVASTEMFNTSKLLSDLRDEQIGPAEDSSRSISILQDMSPSSILAAGLFDTSTVLREILVRQFSSDSIKGFHIRALAKKVKALHARTEEQIERLNAMRDDIDVHSASSHSSYPIGSRSGDSSSTYSLVSWSVDLLQLMVEKAYCILYRSTISDPKLWSKSRKDAIPHYQAFIEIYLRMSTTQTYRKFHWLYPQSYQPFYPTAVLLIDTVKQPRSPERQRSINLIELVFSLVGKKSHITNETVLVGYGLGQFGSRTGAKRAWARLEQLNLRVNTRLGAESNVTRQDTTSVSPDIMLASRPFTRDESNISRQCGVSEAVVVSSPEHSVPDISLNEIQR
jgi:hypothetical protein